MTSIVRNRLHIAKSRLFAHTKKERNKRTLPKKENNLQKKMIFQLRQTRKLKEKGE